MMLFYMYEIAFKGIRICLSFIRYSQTYLPREKLLFNVETENHYRDKYILCFVVYKWSRKLKMIVFEPECPQRMFVN